jgi:hypothetical protein
VDGVVMNGEFGVAGDLDFYVDKRYSWDIIVWLH